MKMNHPMAVVLACVGLSTVSSHACAATSSVVFNNIRAELIDLNPDDGIAPAIVSNRGVYDPVVFYSEANGTWYLFRGSYPGNAIGPWVSANGAAMASITMGAGNWLGQGYNGSSITQAVGEGQKATANATFLDLSLSLTPYTEMRLYADVTISFSGVAGETATAEAGIKVGAGTNKVSWSLDAQGNAFSETVLLTLSFGNYTSNMPIPGSASGLTRVIFYGNSAVESIAAAVPESSTAGLMFGGLVGLVGLARRRR